MEEKGILDILYEEICEGIQIPKEVKDKPFNVYDKMVNLIKQHTKKLSVVKKFEELFSEFEDAEMEGVLYERKEVFKEAYKASERLKKELGAMRVVITDNDVQFDNDILEELFETRVEEIASINDEEKKRDKEQIKHIAYKQVAPKLSKIEIKKLDSSIDEYVDSIYENFGEYNRKYYKNGFKDSFALTFVCSKKR